MVSDDDMKDKLRKMLEDDTTCAKKLTDLRKKGISYDKLWNDTLYSEVCIVLLILLNICILLIDVYFLYSYLCRIELRKGIISVA